MKNVWLDGDGELEKLIYNQSKLTMICHWPIDRTIENKNYTAKMLPTIIKEDCKLVKNLDINMFDFIKARAYDIVINNSLQVFSNK